MLNLKMTSLQYFDNISFHISPNNKKLDISKIYTKWAVEKYPIQNFQTPRKPRNSKNKSGHCFAGHPVVVLARETICTSQEKLVFRVSLYRLLHGWIQKRWPCNDQMSAFMNKINLGEFSDFLEVKNQCLECLQELSSRSRIFLQMTKCH